MLSVTATGWIIRAFIAHNTDYTNNVPPKRITRTAHCPYWIFATCVAERFANLRSRPTSDVHIHRPHVHIYVVAPDTVEQLVA